MREAPWPIRHSGGGGPKRSAGARVGAVNRAMSAKQDVDVEHGQAMGLCPPGYWVAQLPCLAVDDFAPVVCDYRTVSGLLGAGVCGVVEPRDEPWSVREFMESWVAGEMAWGHYDETAGGWATVTDWEQ